MNLARLFRKGAADVLGFGDQPAHELEHVPIASSDCDFLPAFGAVFAVIYRGRGGAADLNIRGGPALDRRIVAERTADQRTFALARKVLRRGEPALEPVLTSTDQVVNDHLSVLPAA